MIKNLDLQRENSRFFDQFLSDSKNVIQSGWYVSGNNLKSFEANFSKFVGIDFCAGVANGLDAITLVLRAWIDLGRLNKGDEVLLPANTYIATILAVIENGLIPIFVEPCKITYCISIDDLMLKISPNSRVILPVHLYGRISNMIEISAIAEKFNLLVLEDCAQSHGARLGGKMAGSFGNAAAFSFYPTKNLGCLGDGGCVVTNDAVLYRHINLLRNYGSEIKYYNDVIGVNSRLDEIQARFLITKLPFLDEMNGHRRKVACTYQKGINNPHISLPDFPEDDLENVWHLFVVRVANRQEFIEHMKFCGIEVAIHYPVAPHKQKALVDYNSLNLNVTEEIHRTVVSLPISSYLTSEEIFLIIDSCNSYIPNINI
jgi:dTDP-4-amino-4,6-dideoxygalactose transaminase